MKTSIPPLQVISLGAGVQSTDLLLRGLRGEFETTPDRAVFSDTGCEPKSVYKYLEWLTRFVDREFGFQIDLVRPGNLYQDILAHCNQETSRADGIPLFVKDGSGQKKGLLKRQCTGHYKIRPVRRFAKQLRQPKQKVEMWLGISLDEIQRMKISGVNWLTNQFPLIKQRLTRHDCIENFKRHQLKIPSRSSCIICPYHSDRYWYWLYKNESESFQAAVELDEKIRYYPGVYDATCYLHRSCLPLKEVIVKIEQNKKLASSQYNLFPELIDECDGVCGY